MVTLPRTTSRWIDLLKSRQHPDNTYRFISPIVRSAAPAVLLIENPSRINQVSAH